MARVMCWPRTRRCGPTARWWAPTASPLACCATTAWWWTRTARCWASGTRMARSAVPAHRTRSTRAQPPSPTARSWGATASRSASCGRTAWSSAWTARCLAGWARAARSWALAPTTRCTPTPKSSPTARWWAPTASRLASCATTAWWWGLTARSSARGSTTARSLAPGRTAALARPTSLDLPSPVTRPSNPTAWWWTPASRSARCGLTAW